MRILLLAVTLVAAATLALGTRSATESRRVQLSFEAGQSGFVALSASLGGIGLAIRIGA